MKKWILLLVLAALLCGCSKKAQPEITQPAATETTPVTAPPTTQPPETEPPKPRNLEPVIGEFFFIPNPARGNYDFREDPKGDHYGFTENYTEECSVWCAVDSYSISAAASSQLWGMEEHTYGPEHLIDGDINTVWCEGVDGCGVGESVEITYTFNQGLVDSDQRFDYRTLCIVNGYAQTKRQWDNNSRVKTLLLYFNGRFVGKLLLKDTFWPQYFDLTGLEVYTMAGEPGTLKFVIDDIYPGDHFTDTALTGIELQFWTPNH